MKTCMVWNQPSHEGELPYGAHIGTQVLHSIVPGLGVLWWSGDRVAAGVGQWDAYIVNLFASMEHVTQIKARQPGAFVVALPDAYFDEVFAGQRTEHAHNFMQQLAAADAIGYVSESNRRFYAAWGKPMVKIPIAIGTDNYFDAMRRVPKEDYLLTCDHSPRTPDYTIQNVAACAMIQRELGVEVVYANVGPQTKVYAAQLGLEAAFYPNMVYEDYVRMAARARVGVDMYALHGFGRNALTLAACGTPCVSSRYTEIAAAGLDAWDAEGAAAQAVALLTDKGAWAVARDEAIRRAQEYRFEAVREEMHEILQRVEELWRSPVCS